MAALLSLKKTFDTKVRIPTDFDDAGKVTGYTDIPIHVARLNRSQLAEVETGWAKTCQRQRGAAATPLANVSADEKATLQEAIEKAGGSSINVDVVIAVMASSRAERDAADAWFKSVEEDQFRFLDETISKHVTIDAGVIDVEGADITTGDGFVRVFYSRLDVLRAVVSALWAENRLTPTLRKNSKSPSASATGSAPSTQEGPAPNGSKPERTATNADSSSTAKADGATDKSGGDTADGSKNSRSDAGEVLH